MSVFNIGNIEKKEIQSDSIRNCLLLFPGHGLHFLVAAEASDVQFDFPVPCEHALLGHELELLQELAYNGE